MDTTLGPPHRSHRPTALFLNLPGTARTAYHTNPKTTLGETVPGWLRSICVCARYMRALRSEALCHIISQWRGTAAELHGCCVRESTVLLLVCQHIDRVT